MLTIRPRSKRLIGLILLGSLVALAVGCTPSHPQSTFDTLGPVSRSQALLFYILLWVGAAVFVGVTGAIIYTVIRYRRRPDEGDPPQIHGHKRLEIAWTIAPALVLAVVAVPGIMTVFDNANSPTPPEEGGLVVDAIAHQWWFEFRYPDHNVVTANELHIPVGEPVNLNLDSVDVIHSFWVPKLAGKVDMIPNNDNTLWMEADEPGVYYGQCAEFCGESHANMRFKVIAESRAEFDSWLQAQTLPSVEPTDPLEVEGRDLFVTRVSQGGGGCLACHTIEGTRARGSATRFGGPNLTHLASRGEFAGSILENTQENLRKWLKDPNKVKPGNIMATEGEIFNDPERGSLKESEISALIAYLRSLK